MTNKSDNLNDTLSLEEASGGISIASAAFSVAHNAGAPIRDADKHAARLKLADGALKTGASIFAGGSAVAAASSLTVAATSGPGIATGLAAAGSVIGGGMAAGPVAIAIGPAYLAVEAVNRTLFSEAQHHDERETAARRKARLAAKIGGGVGVAATGAAVVAGGTSGAAIMGTLGAVGSIVGAGAIAGTVVVSAIPIAAVLGSGYSVYRLFGGGKKSVKPSHASKGN